MPNARVLWDDSVQAFRVSTPYNPQFVELLKQLIPAGSRAWDPSSKIWTIEEKFGLPVKDLCDKVWGTGSTQFMDRGAMAAAQAKQQAAYAQYAQYPYTAPPPRPPVRGDSIDIVLLSFIKLLPYEAARSAYRKAATELHPDKQGGKAELMTALNATWARIEAEFYKKGA